MHLTAIPLRSVAAGELGRWTGTRIRRHPSSLHFAECDWLHSLQSYVAVLSASPASLRSGSCSPQSSALPILSRTLQISWTPVHFDGFRRQERTEHEAALLWGLCPRTIILRVRREVPSQEEVERVKSRLALCSVGAWVVHGPMNTMIPESPLL